MSSLSGALAGIHYATQQPVSIRMEQGLIASVEPLRGQEAGTDDLPLVGPGLVDLQINGYAGIDFNRPGLEEHDMRVFAERMLQAGVTSCFPTIYTNSVASIEACLTAIRQACDADPDLDAMLPGIHLEGPFISPEDGARGAHPQRYVRPPDWELFASWQKLSGGRIRIVTLSPEWPEAESFIRACTAAGVTVAIGHTAADAGQIRRAVEAGARMSTHLGNAAHLMLPRHPNYIWEQLAEDGLEPTVIADGFHLPSSVIKVMMKSKPRGLMLVSDALYVGGLEPGAYTMLFGDVVLTADGWLYNAANPRYLAGSGCLLPTGVEFVVNERLCSPAEAWDMASIRPASFMGLAVGAGIAVGAPADLVLYRWNDGKLETERVYKRGVCRFRRERSGIR